MQCRSVEMTHGEKNSMSEGCLSATSAMSLRVTLVTLVLTVLGSEDTNECGWSAQIRSVKKEIIRKMLVR